MAETKNTNEISEPLPETRRRTPAERRHTLEIIDRILIFIIACIGLGLSGCILYLGIKNSELIKINIGPFKLQTSHVGLSSMGLSIFFFAFVYLKMFNTKDNDKKKIEIPFSPQENEDHQQQNKSPKLLAAIIFISIVLIVFYISKQSPG